MTNNKLVIGLTGGIASGKSQVSRMFGERGVDVLDSDKIAREIFAPHSPHLTALFNRFGESIFSSPGVLDRKALGNIVFSNQEDLNWLNQFSHPLINNQMKKELDRCTSDYVILDIPLLIAKDGHVPEHLIDLVDRILVVKTDPMIQLERVIERDKISQEQAERIISAQSSLKQKLAIADDIVDNNGSMAALKRQVQTLNEYYLNLIKTTS